MLSGLASAAPGPELLAARYAEPVERYGHFAAGRPHEYAELRAELAGGGVASLSLPADQVFEDVAPRIVRLAPGAPAQLLTIVAQSEQGASLALYEVEHGQLRLAARSAAIGTPRRWLNPVGVADLDGDGSAEIAAVITPHIGGILKAYRRVGSELVELARLSGVSNHVYGSAELGLSAIVRWQDGQALLLPDQAREALLLLALRHGRWVELGRCALRAPLVGPLRVAGARIDAATTAGPQTLDLGDCR